MKSLKFCSLALSAGLIAGVFAGWRTGRTFTSGQMVWAEMMAAAGYSELSLLQYEQADSQHGRQALLRIYQILKIHG